jgi:hypothetical protein
MDRFDADVMEDLMSDAAEGPAVSALDQGDEYEEYDEGDEGDEGDAGEDEFLGRLLGGLGGLVGGGAAPAAQSADEGDYYDEYDEGEGYDEAYASDDAYEGVDAMEDAVADALDAGDTDEFFRRLRRIASTVGRGIGSAARVIGPIASMIPIPQAQMIGRLANVAGRLLADGADEFEAIDELVDGLDEDSIDAAAPVLAGMMIRRALPSVARAARPIRRQAVRAVSGAVRQAVRSQGAPAARAVARAVRATRRIAAARRLPPRAIARVAARAAQQVARRPQVARRLSRPLVPAARRATPRGQAARVVARTVTPLARRLGGAAGGMGGVCARCGGRHIRIRGPVTISIRPR